MSEQGITRRRLAEASRPSGTDWERLARQSEQEIAAAVAGDPDAAEVWATRPEAGSWKREPIMPTSTIILRDHKAMPWPNGAGITYEVTRSPESGDFDWRISLADIDNDGFVDLFVASGSGPNLLFHNNGNGTFTDVTAGSGIVVESYATGACIGDYDNDGYDDLLITGFKRNYLFVNPKCIGVFNNGYNFGARPKRHLTF